MTASNVACSFRGSKRFRTEKECRCHRRAGFDVRWRIGSPTVGTCRATAARPDRLEKRAFLVVSGRPDGTRRGLLRNTVVKPDAVGPSTRYLSETAGLQTKDRLTMSTRRIVLRVDAVFLTVAGVFGLVSDLHSYVSGTGTMFSSQL